MISGRADVHQLCGRLCVQLVLVDGGEVEEIALSSKAGRVPRGALSQ